MSLRKIHEYRDSLRENHISETDWPIFWLTPQEVRTVIDQLLFFEPNYCDEKSVTEKIDDCLIVGNITGAKKLFDDCTIYGVTCKMRYSNKTA
jgi:hypothetical protein